MPAPLRQARRLWWVVALMLLVAAILSLAPSGGWPGISSRFLVGQDLPVLMLCLLAAPFASRVRAVTPGLAKLAAVAPWRGWELAIATALALLVLIVAGAGTWLALDNYPLSMDEFMANFDADIFAHGALMAPLARPWRPYLTGLQPIFIMGAPGAWAWSSQYLPVNAALRAIGSLAGARPLVNPLLAAVSVLVTFAVARRLWPDRPRLAPVAAVLLATSSQFLITAMTAYAMPAHLAFNLVWLWLFLRGGRAGHAGAILVGFLACGLHQLAFHVLFVAPFVLQLLLERRWRAGVLYIFAYGAICAFWASYWPILFAVVGPGAPATAGAAAALPPASLVDRVLELLGDFTPTAFAYMNANLVRFFTWQNLLTVPLALIGGLAALRAGGVMRSLALGFVVTAAVEFVLMPYQGHGWGYRYWHGLLGSASLLAAYAWGRITEQLGEEGQARARGGFLAVTAVSALVLFPVRAWQAHGFEHPYARAEAAIRRSPAQVVVVDDSAAWYTMDLVRNDPYLFNHPLVLALRRLSPSQVGALCSRFTIAAFDGSDAHSFGIKTAAVTPSDARVHARLAALRRSACGNPPTPVGVIN